MEVLLVVLLMFVVLMLVLGLGLLVSLVDEALKRISKK